MPQSIELRELLRRPTSVWSSRRCLCERRSTRRYWSLHQTLRVCAPPNDSPSSSFSHASLLSRTNDQEDDRMAVDSIVSSRALREIYLYPFMLAQKYAKPWSYMTALVVFFFNPYIAGVIDPFLDCIRVRYNKLNGTHCSENSWLLRDVLRGEWGHDGLVMSDWSE
jgi:hypothetical protein